MMFTDWIRQVRDWIDVGEYGITYENLVATFEAQSFVITSAGAIKLLEIGLIYVLTSPSSVLNVGLIGTKRQFTTGGVSVLEIYTLPLRHR